MQCGSNYWQLLRPLRLSKLTGGTMSLKQCRNIVSAGLKEFSTNGRKQQNWELLFCKRHSSSLEKILLNFVNFQSCKYSLHFYRKLTFLGEISYSLSTMLYLDCVNYFTKKVAN